ncbi:RING-H2 finger protein ATL74-like [Cornus florida]|uniref:RING-H2 finger protein ATL74-like n=1 Tax=Cornus florida TaxID=4283 RepID=UPI0028988C78|nr:RING-H2 finger protein ATL74-like [Cornus florida]
MNSQALGLATQVMVMAIVISVILLFVGIGVLVLIHVCIVGSALRSGFGNNTRAERGSFGSTSMSQEDLEKLPCFDFKPKEKGSSSPVDCCAVCLDNFKIGDKCRLLPTCNHSFHAQCVDSWLLMTPICPICRASADSWKGDGSAWGEGSSRFSDSGIELRDGQTTENTRLSDVGIELRESQTTENTHLSDSGVELNENQTASVGAQLSLNATPSHVSVEEPAV